jgi:hypothetical protein
MKEGPFARPLPSNRSKRRHDPRQLLAREADAYSEPDLVVIFIVIVGYNVEQPVLNRLLIIRR